MEGREEIVLRENRRKSGIYNLGHPSNKVELAKDAEGGWSHHSSGWPNGGANWKLC